MGCGASSPRRVRSTHIEGQTLCHRIVTQGYYWLTMKQKSKSFMRKCDVCQQFGNVIHVLTETLHFVTSPWSFHKWGIDVVGPFPLASSQRKFMLVASDYFIKWVEVEAYAQIKATQLIQFLKKKKTQCADSGFLIHSSHIMGHNSLARRSSSLVLSTESRMSTHHLDTPNPMGAWSRPKHCSGT